MLYVDHWHVIVEPRHRVSFSASYDLVRQPSTVADDVAGVLLLISMIFSKYSNMVLQGSVGCICAWSRWLALLGRARR